MRAYKKETPCDNCPFAEEGAGLQLRLSLGKGRWSEILKTLDRGSHFLCHKTTGDWENEPVGRRFKTAQICAGARHYQSKKGIVSDAEQIMERLLTMKAMENSTTQGGPDNGNQRSRKKH